ncbi:MAG: DUF192 domain-containing protein [Candidatus Pacebacteria bacterium]|nr:DUF192 domain-containing protein [Candidatus Paceibacterota bacterium]
MFRSHMASPCMEFYPLEMFRFLSIFFSVLILCLLIFKGFSYNRKIEITKNSEETGLGIGFYDREINLGGKTFFIDIAETNRDRSSGLSGRKSISSNQGMLFVFDKSDKQIFWMKGMLFPIDFIWIKDNKIIDITKNAMPITSIPKIYMPNFPVNMVLEIASGGIENHGLKVGDKLEIIK